MTKGKFATNLYKNYHYVEHIKIYQNYLRGNCMTIWNEKTYNKI